MRIENMDRSVDATAYGIRGWMPGLCRLHRIVSLHSLRVMLFVNGSHPLPHVSDADIGRQFTWRDYASFYASSSIGAYAS